MPLPATKEAKMPRTGKVLVITLVVLALATGLFPQESLGASTTIKIYQNRDIAYMGVHPVGFNGASSGWPASIVDFGGGINSEVDSMACLRTVLGKSVLQIDTLEDTLVTMKTSGGGYIPMGEGVYITPKPDWGMYTGDQRIHSVSNLGDAGIIFNSDVDWIYNEEDTADAAPDMGFFATDTAFKVYNNDDYSFTVSNFKYVKNQPASGADDLWDWPGWATADTIWDFDVEANDSAAVAISGMETGTYLYTRYDIYVNDTMMATKIDVQEIPEPTAVMEQPSPETSDLTVNALDLGGEIRYQVAQPGHVELAVYSTDGRKVTTLVSEHQTSGSHTITWDGTDDVGSKVSAGVYFCRLSAEGLQIAEKVIRLK
ncbi:T9SS type A sorting domain-containing protein [candidate division WOR-3 bacterium]|nr:T9SS type A sorting domain-containing protein [candidate division WOR-3 bacterium]